MQRRRVVLDISPSRLELALVAGRAVLATHTHALATDLLDDWPAALDSIRPVLQGWTARHKLHGLPTTVLYTSPDSHAGVLPIPEGVAHRAAVQAGRLALADAVSFPLDLNPHVVTPVRTGRAVDAHAPLLGIADTDASLAAIFTLVENTGLRVTALLPAAAALIAHTLRCAAALPQPGAARETTLLLNLGEHSSVLAAVSAGRIRFVRNFAVGVDSFVDALRRPIASRQADRPTLHLDRAAARQILFAAGVPRREETVDAQRGIDGAALLPLLQPVLQRCAVEVKQSLRFGLDEAERATVGLRLLGHAQSIQRLGEAIAEIHGDPLRCLPAAESPEPSKGEGEASTPHGAIAAFLASGSPQIFLLPREVQNAKGVRSVTRALWAGIAAAALLVAADGVLTHLSLRAEAVPLDSNAAGSDAADPAPLRIYDQALAARSGVAAARARMDAALGGVTDWSAVLAALSTLTPDAIRLRSIDLLDEPGNGPVCRIRAAASPAGDAEPAVLIKQYLDALQAVPLTASVRLGATGRTVVGGEPVHEFELLCELVPLQAFALPAAAHHPTAHAAEPTP